MGTTNNSVGPNTTGGKPTISVLMSVYNGARFLREAVDSILYQTFSDFEFIIVDDGSKDGTSEILESYRDARVVHMRNETNIGMTNSLVRAMGTAQGEFIARMDADDVSMPERLSYQVAELIRRPTLAAIFSAFDHIDSEGRVLKTITPPQGSQALREALLYSNPLAHSSVMFRRELLERAGGYDATWELAQDYELWFRLSQQFEIDSLPVVLQQLRIHSSSITARRRLEQRRNTHAIRDQAYARMAATPLTPRTLGLYHYVAALDEFSEGNGAAGREQIERAVSADPQLEEAQERMLAMAVNVAVELGPSGLALIGNKVDEQAAEQFLHALLDSLPKDRLVLLQRNIPAEYHATCAYLYGKQGRTWPAAKHLLQSWIAGPRHRRNLGLIRAVIGATRS